MKKLGIRGCVCENTARDWVVAFCKESRESMVTTQRALAGEELTEMLVTGIAERVLKLRGHIATTNALWFFLRTESGFA
jgi:HPt (histidine-containing phosphotransfer) domain-containing protein